MSTETLSSLNTNTLIGHTLHRGTAWHYRAEEQGKEPNHYPGPVPPEDVARRLFGWEALALPVAVERPADILTMTHRGADGMPRQWVQIEGRQAIARSDEDDGHVLGVFTDAYEAHQYTEYLLTAVTNILDDSLSISSAGVLRKGAVAWVEVSVPESITTPEGVEFRPNLLATTALDGSLATTYKRTVTDVVCDNTRAAALREEGQELKIRHLRHSRLRLADARSALNIVHGLADALRRRSPSCVASTSTPGSGTASSTPGSPSPASTASRCRPASAGSPRPSGRPSPPPTSTTSGWRPGPAPRTPCCRRSTPSSTTTAPHPRLGRTAT